VRYETPDRRHGQVRDVIQAIRAARRIVLTTHVNADGDGVGSEVAMCAWLRACGAEAWIVNPTPFPASFEFLLPDPTWVVPVTEEKAKRLCGSADLAVVLDTGEIPRVGRVRPLISDLETVVVDHHPPGDQPIAGVSFRDPSACATGEMVYDVIRAARGPWPRAALEGIYVAILTDTGSFRFSNSTPACHRVAADLIEKGVDPEEIHRRVYGAFPLRRFQLLQVCLDTLQVDPDGSVAWMMVPRDAFERLKAAPDDLEGLVDYPRMVEGVEVGLLFRQTPQGDTKISFRSNGPVDVNRVARAFGGGGHVRASGAMVTGPPHKVVPKVLAATLEAVRAERS
jgi:phosphoesterase RecJ-like protein